MKLRRRIYEAALTLGATVIIFVCCAIVLVGGIAITLDFSTSNSSLMEKPFSSQASEGKFRTFPKGIFDY
ncbi:MAG: hypothetical protein AB3N28_04760 [Kordiimonas sp.]